MVSVSVWPLEIGPFYVSNTLRWWSSWSEEQNNVTMHNGVQQQQDVTMEVP